MNKMLDHYEAIIEIIENESNKIQHKESNLNVINNFEKTFQDFYGSQILTKLLIRKLNNRYKELE